MHQYIFVNLPVEDLDRSRAFFTELGYAFEEDHSDDRALCMILGEGHYAMLLRRDFFQTFTPRPVADETASTAVIVALSVSARDEVDRSIERAIAAGGTEAGPVQDHGFMYHRSFADPDGHIWEMLWMDEPEETSR